LNGITRYANFIYLFFTEIIKQGYSYIYPVILIQERNIIYTHKKYIIDISPISNNCSTNRKIIFVPESLLVWRAGACSACATVATAIDVSIIGALVYIYTYPPQGVSVRFNFIDNTLPVSQPLSARDGPPSRGLCAAKEKK